MCSNKPTVDELNATVFPFLIHTWGSFTLRADGQLFLGYTPWYQPGMPGYTHSPGWISPRLEFWAILVNHFAASCFQPIPKLCAHLDQPRMTMDDQGRMDEWEESICSWSILTPSRGILDTCWLHGGIECNHGEIWCIPKWSKMHIFLIWMIIGCQIIHCSMYSIEPSRPFILQLPKLPGNLDHRCRLWLDLWRCLRSAARG